jgi:hypothetical protein
MKQFYLFDQAVDLNGYNWFPGHRVHDDNGGSEDDR